MKIIITENQKYILRRLEEFFEVIEEMIDDYEYDLQDNPRWCLYSNPDSFFNTIRLAAIDEFMNQNLEFFRDESEKGGSNFSLLNKIVEEYYGKSIRNMFVRECK
jgi:hypothetical protein